MTALNNNVLAHSQETELTDTTATPVAAAISARTVASMIDATILRADCSWQEIMELIDEAVNADYASVCIPPYLVKEAVYYINEKQVYLPAEKRLPVCTVIAFPLGYNDTQSKLNELQAALANGAKEVDVVVNIALVKQGLWHEVEKELRLLRSVSRGKILKLIIECCYLNSEEKIKLCDLVSKHAYDFIKTSTGFGTGGATVEDVALLRARCAPFVKVKASGGIRDLQFARELVAAGAERLGLSNPGKLFKE